MKKIILAGCRSVLLSALITSHNLSAQTHPLSGEWKSEETTLKVREKKGFLKYEFHEIRVSAVIRVDKDGKAAGRIGTSVEFNSVTEKNKGKTERTGIAYIIKCGKTGNLHTKDPNREKEIEIWIRPLNTDDKFRAEIRQMEFMDAFPMGEMTFRRSQDGQP